jgi:hypothetical protein
MSTENINKKIDVFIYISIILSFITIIFEFWVVSGIFNLAQVFLVFLGSFLALISLVIALIRVRVRKRTRHLGFIPTILLVTFESFLGFGVLLGGVVPAIVFVFLFAVTSKYWR